MFLLTQIIFCLQLRVVNSNMILRSFIIRIRPNLCEQPYNFVYDFIDSYKEDNVSVAQLRILFRRGQSSVTSSITKDVLSRSDYFVTLENLYKAPVNSLENLFRGGHSLFVLILAALLPCLLRRENASEAIHLWSSIWETNLARKG